MPVLKIVAACEKVIFDQDGPVSIISLFESMLFRLQEAPLPEKAVVPNQWCVFTLWESNPLEVGQEFSQIIRVFTPDGTLFSENEMPFRSGTADDTQIRVRLQFKALPIWQEGKIQVTVHLKGTETELGSTCFRIRYLPKEDAESIQSPSV